MIMGWLVGPGLWIASPLKLSKLGMIGSQKKAWRSGGFFEPVEVLECCGNFMKLQHYAARVPGFAENIWIHKPQLFCEDQGIPGFLHG